MKPWYVYICFSISLFLDGCVYALKRSHNPVIGSADEWVVPMALFLESIYNIKIITVTITMNTTAMKTFDIPSIGFVDRGAEHKIIYI